MSTTRLTLTQATTLPRDEWDGGDGYPGLQVQDLEITRDERQRLASAWLWLCGVKPTAREAARVGNEALTDGPLLIALSLPAAEFRDWFRQQEWNCFDATERTGGEAWAWGVLDRARAAADAMGHLAGQCPLSPPSTWPAGQ